MPYQPPGQQPTQPQQYQPQPTPQQYAPQPVQQAIHQPVQPMAQQHFQQPVAPPVQPQPAQGVPYHVQAGNVQQPVGGYIQGQQPMVPLQGGGHVAPPPGAFSGINQAQRRNRSSTFRPGGYWVRIDGMKYQPDRLTNWRFITETTVIRVIDNGPTGSPNPVGDNPSYMLKRATDYFLSDLNAMIGGILGLPAADITEQNIYDLISERQPLRNMIVEVQVVGKPRNKIDTRTGQPLPDWNNVYFKREVPASEALGVLDAHSQERFFPGQGLQRMAQLEAQLLAQQQQQR